MWHKWLVVPFVACLLGLLGGVAHGQVRLRVAEFAAMSSAAIHLAQDRGYFREQGLAPEFIDFKTSGDALPALATGEVDLYIGGWSAGTFNAFARGIQMKFVASRTCEMRGNRRKPLMARKDLFDSGAIRSLADLRGKPVGSLPGKGNTLTYQLHLMLRSAGLDLKDVEVVGLPLPDMVAAMKNRRVAATFTFEPIATRIEQLGLGVRLTTLGDISPGYMAAAITYGDAFIRQKPELGRRFLLAYLRGVRDYADAMHKRKGRREVIEILVRHQPIKDLALYEKIEWEPADPNGRVNRRSLEEEMRWYVQQGLAQRVVPLDDIVDDRFVEHAQRELGPYDVEVCGR
ncbi:MAG: ABC transporter substrate-binding protein [Deltaproteobacteria bacterium]|nr:ABC transporter substrate-binding protein [Deltaproteobacteria bacterium]